MSIGAAFVITIGLRQGANLFARMAAYYEIAVGITLPWMINKLFTKQSAQLVSIAAIVLYFVYFLYEFGVSKTLAQITQQSLYGSFYRVYSRDFSDWS